MLERATQLVNHAQELGIIESIDRIWAYNTLEPLVRAQPGISDEQLLGALLPRPSEIARRFWSLHAEDPKRATDWFYQLCEDADYVHRGAMAEDIRWTSPTKWGELQITINLSKPEKDPAAIAAAAKAAENAVEAYPTCELCMENEGYAGRPIDDPVGPHAERKNLRIIPFEFGRERWGLQYSPYAYFNEHCIAMSSAHRPMRMDATTIKRLLDFVDLFPHYFIGSNADLPIVGGSILSHDHFQGGMHEMPLQNAPADCAIKLDGYPKVKVSRIHWPLTVIRLEAFDRAELEAVAGKIMETWRAFDDPDCGIVSHDEDGQHNTVTPIARRDYRITTIGRRKVYTLDLALRCNITNERHPLGVFHPHEELWHIKKENIGLIEVMGLAILPPRLQRELASIGEELLGNRDFENNPHTRSHASWARKLVATHPDIAVDNVEDVLKDEVAAEFARVLEHCGVFKWDDAGQAGFERFLNALNES